MTSPDRYGFSLAAVVALAALVLVTLPWPPLGFGLLSLVLIGLHGWLATGDTGLRRFAWWTLAVFWVLVAASSFYAPPTGNIRVDWVFAQRYALPLTAIVHALLAGLTGWRQGRNG